MALSLDLFVLAVPNHSPDGLLAIPAKDRAALSTFTRTIELRAQPPPDTLFMRATGIDLSVFGENTLEGELQMIDAESLKKHSEPQLRHAVVSEPSATVATLAAFGRGHRQQVDEAALALALASNAWPASADPLVQAAAFARVLFEASQLALPAERSLVWLVRGGPISYRYP